MAREVVVATDSAASFAPNEAERMGVAKLPLHIVWPNGSQTTDAVMSPEDFYKKMLREGIPTTSGANVSDFLDLYRNLIAAGAKKILSIHVSGIKSMVLASARIAAEMLNEADPNLHIQTVDSRAVSGSQLYVVEAAAAAVARGASFEESALVAEAASKNVELYITLPNLEHVIRGGRLKGASAILASALRILPLISMQEDGDLHITQKIRGDAAKVRGRMVEVVESLADQNGLPERIGVIYTQIKDLGDEVREAIKARLNIAVDEPREAGSVLAVHAGPGATGIALRWKLHETI
jgi:DegV family protein with EDD domain